jgi:DNA-binding response OmpR family regulator
MQKNEILVVDDEAVIRNVFKKSFTRAGYWVETAESAEAALEILNRKYYHLMFLDLNLPEMNGIELCRRIKKDKPIAILYAVTAYSSLFELTDCREAGFDDYFIKPVNMKTILAAVEYGFEKIERWKGR